MKRIYNYRTNELYEFENIQEANILDESENDTVTYKLCVREEALSDDVDVDDDVEFEDVYETLEDALDAVNDAMTSAAETEDEDFEELDCDDCDDCRVFESPSKRFIFVACPVDEEPNFDIEVVDGEVEREIDDIPLDDEDFEDDLDSDIEDEFEDDDMSANESVANRFARLRELFESESDEISDKDVTEGEDEESEDDDNASDESQDDEKSEDDNSDNAEDTEDEKSEEDEEEDEEMRAVALTVKTEDVDKCKEELIDAGIAEDDIEVLDDNDGETQIRVDVNSIMELKDYLEKKGIDLEEEIGGEIVSDEDDDTSDSDDVEQDADVDDDSDEEVPEFNLDDLGDIFGADEE